MLDTIYANKISKSEASKYSDIVYWFMDNKQRLIGIVSDTYMELNDIVVLYSSTGKFISFLEKPYAEPKETIYYKF